MREPEPACYDCGQRTPHDHPDNCPAVQLWRAAQVACGELTGDTKAALSQLARTPFAAGAVASLLLRAHALQRECEGPADLRLQGRANDLLFQLLGQAEKIRWALEAANAQRERLTAALEGGLRDVIAQDDDPGKGG